MSRHSEQMQLSRVERILLLVALFAGLTAAWQLVLYAGDNSFLDGICASLGVRALPPGARALRLFRWVSSYDALPQDAAPAPDGLVTPRAIVEHGAYFRRNCGSKAWLLTLLARRAGLPARELRLCDAAHVARHVVCEVRLSGRWVVLDPTAHLVFRRADGQLATAAELRDPGLLAANAARAGEYDGRRWRFEHAERLHFEKLPLLGGGLRRLAGWVSGRPAAELAPPAVLGEPRLVAAGSLLLLTLLALAAASASARRRARRRERRILDAPPPQWGLALETADQD